jgi:DNA-binding response OmpR family regulator
MAQILIVEDEVALVDVIKTVLTNAGHTVLQAYDGQEGEEIALRDRPDLVVADHMLPVKTGLDLCKTLKESDVEPPISFLLMTAGNVPVEDACPDAILRKPFAIEEFEALVNSLLQQRAPTFFG